MVTFGKVIILNDRTRVEKNIIWILEESSSKQMICDNFLERSLTEIVYKI